MFSPSQQAEAVGRIQAEAVGVNYPRGLLRFAEIFNILLKPNPSWKARRTFRELLKATSVKITLTVDNPNTLLRGSGNDTNYLGWLEYFPAEVEAKRSQDRTNNDQHF